VNHTYIHMTISGMRRDMGGRQYSNSLDPIWNPSKICELVTEREGNLELGILQWTR